MTNLILVCFIQHFWHMARNSGWLKQAILLGLCLLLFWNQVPAQSLSVGYAGNNLWNPGVQVGMNLAIYPGSKWHYTGQLGGFWDPDSYVGAYAQVGIGYEIIVSEVTNIQVGIMPLGCFRSFLPETYSVSDLGEVSRITLPGSFYFAPSLRGRWCRMLRLMEGEWFVGLQGMLLTGYNTYSLPLLQVEAGVSVPVGRLVSREVGNNGKMLRGK